MQREDNDQLGSPFVVEDHSDEDEEDEKEVEELIKCESDDDRTPSTNSRTAHPLLGPIAPNPNPSPISTPSPTLGPTLDDVLDQDNATALPNRVQYKLKITHPTGKFKHRVGLDRDEPVPKFKYSLEQRDRFSSHIRIEEESEVEDE